MVKARFARLALSGGAALAALAMLAPVPAMARVHVGIGIGVPLVAPPLYAPPVYYAPPAYYPPPPPPPVYYAPPAAVTPPPVPAPAASQCREYTTTTVIGGHPQQVVGTACREPDGTWRIVD